MISRDDLEFERLLGACNPSKLIRYDFISASTYPSLFQVVRMQKIPMLSIIPSYAKLVGKDLGLYAGPIHELFSNALCWGNNNDTALSLEVKVYSTGDGRILQLHDQGQGFDVDATIAAFNSGDNYAMRHGGGFADFMTNLDFTLYFADNGSTSVMHVK